MLPCRQVTGELQCQTDGRTDEITDGGIHKSLLRWPEAVECVKPAARAVKVLMLGKVTEKESFVSAVITSVKGGG